MYGRISDLTSQNIDTKQLLGLIRSKSIEEEAQDEFKYEDNDDCFDNSDIEDGML